MKGNYVRNALLAILTGAVMFWSAPAKAQGSILNTHAFFTITMPGNIPVDENGNRINIPQNIERFIYIEVRGLLKPQITKVYYDGVPYTAVVEPVVATTFEVGKNFRTGKKHIIKARTGNRSWKLVLEKASDKPAPAPGAKRIVLYNKVNGRTVKVYTYKEIQLQVTDRY